MFSDVRAETRFVARQGSLMGAQPLDWRELRLTFGAKPKGDTFFILGSGSSVEELDARDFAEIGANQSVGINNWPLHPFVPDFYCFENVPWVGDGRDLERALRLLSREDIIARRPSLLVLRPKETATIDLLAMVPRKLHPNLFCYGRITPATRRAENLSADLDVFFHSIAPRNRSVVLDSGASVVRMAVLGLLLGYRNITFVGVDLNNTEYFWERNPSYLEGLASPPPVNNQNPGLHETVSQDNRPFGVLDMIRGLSRYVESSLGGRLRVASRSSALAEFLEVHRWGQS